MSFRHDRKLLKAVTEDAPSYSSVQVAPPSSASDVRKLFKAFSDNPAFHAAVRACKSPAEKHEVIRLAGLAPVTQEQIEAELVKCLSPRILGTFSSPTSAEDHEFVGNVLHLAAASSSEAV